MDFKEDTSGDMMRMLANGSQHDVKIILDDGEIRAHRDILAFRCEYFAIERKPEPDSSKGSIFSATSQSTGFDFKSFDWLILFS